MIAPIVLFSAAVLLVAYFIYGKRLSRRFDLDDSQPTPAVKVNDGVDYVPASSGLLLGQHFSAIAAAGPVVGPIPEQWDGQEASRRIELHVGRDLQFIRINGTVVGALAGIAIHAVAQLLG